ncbi:MAG: 50S ribosomal protein L24 [Candidatus Diapherotrites archaeon]|nr:50S ribosomal protein L24 [Candidatus Diapherotrites archaeon]
MNVQSAKPNKQRKARFRAKIHERGKYFRAHLSETLQKQFKQKTSGVRKGDQVKVMRGQFRGKTGKVTGVDRKRFKLHIEKIVRKKAKGNEIFIPIAVSNVMIMERTERNDAAASKPAAAQVK